MAIYVFYDSSSKMYLIYTTLYYIITFSPATGYVLLAANIEDFRTLAKRLIPEHLAHLADDIFDVAKDVVIKESARQNSIGFRYNSDDTFTKGTHWEQSGEGLKTTRKKHHHKHKTTNTTESATESITPHYEFNIDELVEKVKQKLKYEFQLKPSKGRSGKNSNENEDHTIKEENTEATQNYHDNDENYNNLKQTQKERYVADIFVNNPPKYMLEYNKNKKPTLTTKTKEVYSTYTEENKHTTETPEGNDLFVEVDLGNWNSDEDKVAPKKSNNKSKIKQAVVAHSDKEINIFSDEVVTKHKDRYDDEQGNFNKDNAIRNNKVTLTDVDEKETFSPYAKQIDSTETTKDNKKQVTELPHIILIDDDGDEREKLKLSTNPNKNKKGIRKPKKNTVIPKRDFYKISSPNYLLKAPIIGEKYHFDEPIPEEDREAEHLKYIGNPPASINGKVVFTNK